LIRTCTIAFAGGVGISRISLSTGLKEKTRQQFYRSIIDDRHQNTVIAVFTLEGFYTHLNDCLCYLFPLARMNLDSVFEEKPVGPGATVGGYYPRN